MEKVSKVLVAPDSFKNSLTASEVAEHLSQGLTYFKGKLEAYRFPFADGGEGSLKVIERFIDCEKKTIFTFDPFLKPIRADYLLDRKHKTAYIESANVIGLEVIEGKPDTYNASSFGLGKMIADALDEDVTQVFIFLGGSATSDGGVGMAAALGYQFFSEKRVIERPLARDVKYIQEIDSTHKHRRIDSCIFHVAHDVENQLTGSEGAAFMYARQKGANDEQIELLELGMENLRTFIKEMRNLEINEVVGSGAAGGLGAGCKFFLNGKLSPAFDILADISKLNERIQESDVVITGEGHIDAQSFHGKLISKIYERSALAHKPVWLVCAIRSISEKEAIKAGFEKIESIYRSSPKEIDIEETKRELVKIGKKWAKEWLEI